MDLPPAREKLRPLSPILKLALGAFFLAIDAFCLVLDGWPIRESLRCRECRGTYSASDLFCPHCGRWPNALIATPLMMGHLIVWGVGRLAARFRIPAD